MISEIDKRWVKIHLCCYKKKLHCHISGYNASLYFQSLLPLEKFQTPYWSGTTWFFRNNNKQTFIITG